MTLGMTIVASAIPTASARAAALRTVPARRRGLGTAQSSEAEDTDPDRYGVGRHRLPARPVHCDHGNRRSPTAEDETQEAFNDHREEAGTDFEAASVTAHFSQRVRLPVSLCPDQVALRRPGFGLLPAKHDVLVDETEEASLGGTRQPLRRSYLPGRHGHGLKWGVVTPQPPGGGRTEHEQRHERDDEPAACPPAGAARAGRRRHGRTWWASTFTDTVADSPWRSPGVSLASVKRMQNSASAPPSSVTPLVWPMVSAGPSQLGSANQATVRWSARDPCMDAVTEYCHEAALSRETAAVPSVASPGKSCASSGSVTQWALTAKSSLASVVAGRGSVRDQKAWASAPPPTTRSRVTTAMDTDLRSIVPQPPRLAAGHLVEAEDHA